MKQYVHEAIAREGSDATWTRTLLDVGAPVQAWVYHKIRANPYTYSPLDRTGLDPKSAAKSKANNRKLRNPKPLTADAPEPVSADQGAYGADTEGQVKIPDSILAQLRVGPGVGVHIRCDALNQTVVITRANQFLGGDFDEQCDVRDDGTILLKEATLAKAEIDGMQSYHIETKANEISVSEFV
jgi:hypothetical protein